MWDTLDHGPVAEQVAGQQVTMSAESAAVRPEPDGRRVVIVHYHLFKNAGTSIDRALKAQCGKRWTSIESDHGDRKLPTNMLRELILSRPELLAISSHTAPIEPHLLGDDLHIFPIVFLRHPIDRMRSAYDFERHQGAETFGSRTARAMDFPGYVEHFIRHRSSRSFRDYQSYCLADASSDRQRGELDRALDGMGRLAFVGVVEHYEISLREIERRMQRLLPAFRLTVEHANAGGRDQSSLELRLARIRHQLTPALFEEALSHNLRDLVLWERARSAVRHLERRPQSISEN